MPVPSKRLKELAEGTVDHHASLTHAHPGLQEITIRWRGTCGYMAARAGPGDDTAEEIRLCRIEYLGDDEVRRRMVGSFEITEILKKRFETMVSSGQWGSSAGAWVTSVSSPFGASFGREREFHMHVNAELIIYGGTSPDAKVRVDGHDISLSKDGTFHYHFVFPDGNFHIPIDATSADGAETRSALLSFLRMTELEGDVRKTGQPRIDEPIGRK